jgi:signal transduction histidine kinase
MARGISTFRSKVFFPILSLVLTTVALMGYLYVLRQSAIIEKDLVKRGDSLVTVLAKNLKLGISTRSDEYMDEAMKSTVDIDDVLGVRVYASDGKALRDAGKKGRPRQNLVPTTDLFSKDLSNKVFQYKGHMELMAPVYYIESGIGRSDLDLYPVETGKKVVIGFVVLSLSKESIVVGTKDVRNLAVTTALLFCIVGGLIAYYIASRITLPLSTLVMNIRDIEVHGLRSIPVDGDYEIRELAVAFNKMADALGKREKELHSLASALSLSEERERYRIATDLHDNVGQALALSKMKLGMLLTSVPNPYVVKELSEIRELIAQAIQYSRSLMVDLSPPVLQVDLSDAIKEFAEQIGEKHGLQINWESSGQLLLINNETCMILYKAVRELLINIVKHAQAKAVTVSVRKDEGDIRISVEDDGVGFDTQRIELHSKTFNECFGLINIRERLKDIGGVLVVEAGCQQGTRATITVPSRSENHGA